MEDQASNWKNIYATGKAKLSMSKKLKAGTYYIKVVNQLEGIFDSKLKVSVK